MFIKRIKSNYLGNPNKVINHGMYKSCKNGYITN